MLHGVPLCGEDRPHIDFAFHHRGNRKLRHISNLRENTALRNTGEMGIGNILAGEQDRRIFVLLHAKVVDPGDIRAECAEMIEKVLLLFIAEVEDLQRLHHCHLVLPSGLCQSLCRREGVQTAAGDIDVGIESPVAAQSSFNPLVLVFQQFQDIFYLLVQPLVTLIVPNAGTKAHAAACTGGYHSAGTNGLAFAGRGPFAGALSGADTIGFCRALAGANACRLAAGNTLIPAYAASYRNAIGLRQALGLTVGCGLPAALGNGLRNAVRDTGAKTHAVRGSNRMGNAGRLRVAIGQTITEAVADTDRMAVAESLRTLSDCPILNPSEKLSD